MQGGGSVTQHLRHILSRPSRSAPFRTSNFLALPLLVALDELFPEEKSEGKTKRPDATHVSHVTR